MKVKEKESLDSDFCALGPEIMGVIFNRVASESHYRRLKDGVQDAPVVGYLPRELSFEIPHRHLGLTIAEESPLAGESINRLADTVLNHIDVDLILRNAEVGVQNRDHFGVYGHDAKEILNPEFKSFQKTSRLSGSNLYGSGLSELGIHDKERAAQGKKRFTVAVAYDKAFSFYYEDNLDLLSDAGGEIIRFSPLADQAIPDKADAVYIGGGYPELRAAALSRNSSMLRSIRAWADAGKPLYAECGGLMYLSKGIRDFDGNFFPMAGVFPFETRMMKKPRLGYREILLNEGCIVGNKGEKFRGHEFHYSEIRDGTAGQIYSLSDSRGKALPTEGFGWKNTLASYVHVHFGSNRRIAQHFAGCIKGDSTA